MSTASRSLSPIRNVDSILAAVAGFIIIHYLTRHGGIGVSPDSVDYISTAANIQDSGRGVNFAGSALVNFPLGYPLLISGLISLTRMDPLQFGPVLDGLLFAAVILLSGMIMEGFAYRSKWYKIAVLSIIVLSPCLLEIYSMIWSETIFILLSLLFIFFCQRYFRTPTLLALLWPALVAALACSTRYAGITMIATGGLMIWLNGGMRPVKRIGHLFFFGLVAYSLLAINLWRNVEKTGTLTGHREKGLESFWVVLHDFGSVSLGWLGLPDHYYIFAVAMGVLLILLFFVVFVLRWRRSPHFFSYENLAIAYFIIYAVFILLTATISRFQQLDSRLLSPLFIPFLWGCYSMIASSIHGRMAGRIAGRMTGRMTAMKEERGVAGWVVMGILLAGFVIVQYGQVRTYRENWEGIADAGIPGYTEDDWRHSATMEFIRRNKDSLEEANTLYTNADDAIWFLTGMHAVLLPHKDFTMDVQTLLAKDHFNVAWFNDGINPDLVSVATIGRYKKLARVAAFPDGAVYFFTTK